MLSVEKSVLRLLIFSVFYTIFSIFVSGNEKTLDYILLVGSIILYVEFFLCVIKIIYNRKRIIEDSKCPIFLLIMNVYLTNFIYLSLIVWVLQRIYKDNFTNINSYFDSLYYTLITFSTVGYGDILPSTIIAKIVCILIIASNFLLLLAFLNLFVMKAKKKEDYLNEVVFSIHFLFEEMSSCCSNIDKSNIDNKSWSEWVDAFIRILADIENENLEKEKELEKIRENVRQYNSQCSNEEDMKEIPYLFINGKDELLIETLIYSGKKVIEKIEFLESNKISLLENENLSEEQFYLLSEIKDGFKTALRQYRYGIKVGNNMMQVFKSDLLGQMERLGYKQYNYVKFKGYGIDNSDDNQLAIAMMRVDVTNKSEAFWLKAKCRINNLLKL